MTNTSGTEVFHSHLSASICDLLTGAGGLRFGIKFKVRVRFRGG